MLLLFMLLLQGPTVALPIDFDLARVRKVDPLAVLERCTSATSVTEIVVCALRHDHTPAVVQEAWRDPSEEPPDDARLTRGTGMAALKPAGPCGVFAGQHACGKTEATRYGYGRGRNPVTFFKKLADKLIDPDAN